MAMKPCRDCGEQVSTKAKQCPHCGRSQPKPLVGCVLAIIVILVLLWLLLSPGSLASL